MTYCASEIALALFKRAKASTRSADQGSIQLLWIVITLSITLSVYLSYQTRWADSAMLARLRGAWFMLFAFAIALRWWAIIHLGRFFTVNVAIATDQHVVEDGPYRLVRHPSYTGALLAFLAYGLARGNWVTLVVMMAPVTAAFLWRMRIEERALRSALGEPYAAYSARTKRLVPFVY